MNEAQKEIADRNLHDMLTHENSYDQTREQKISKLKEQLDEISKEHTDLV